MFPAGFPTRWGSTRVYLGLAVAKAALEFPMRLFAPFLMAAAGLAALPCAVAQSGEVSVELTRVSEAMAQRLGYDEARLPMSVLVPPAVAAEACGIPAEMFTPPRTGANEGCVAAKPTSGLERVVRSRVRSDEALGGPPATSSHGKTGPDTRR